MALKLGTENKRNMIIAGVLFCVVAYLGISQLMSGPSVPATPAAPVAAPARSTAVQRSPANQTARTTSPGGTTAPTAHKLPSSGLDPALHLEKLAASESIEYAGSGRNIFSADSAPVAIETLTAGARPDVAAAPVVTGPPPPPQPPANDLKFFGYSANKDGKREAFLLHGDDIFEAATGEIVNHRYKVVSVDPHSIQLTDLSYNNTQTLQLSTN